MGFRIYCNNKGCGQDQEPLLDLATSQVMCTECGQEIKDVTQFTKNSMKGLGQVKRDVAKKQAFSVNCQSCSKDVKPEVKSDKAYCPLCSAHMSHVSKPYILALRSLQAGALK